MYIDARIFHMTIPILLFLSLQMLMNALKALSSVILMPSAPIPSAPTPAHVGLATLGMATLV